MLSWPSFSEKASPIEFVAGNRSRVCGHRHGKGHESESPRQDSGKCAHRTLDRTGGGGFPHFEMYRNEAINGAVTSSMEASGSVQRIALEPHQVDIGAFFEHRTCAPTGRSDVLPFSLRHSPGVRVQGRPYRSLCIVTLHGFAAKAITVAQGRIPAKAVMFHIEEVAPESVYDSPQSRSRVLCDP